MHENRRAFPRFFFQLERKSRFIRKNCKGQRSRRSAVDGCCSIFISNSLLICIRMSVYVYIFPLIFIYFSVVFCVFLPRPRPMPPPCFGWEMEKHWWFSAGTGSVVHPASRPCAVTRQQPMSPVASCQLPVPCNQWPVASCQCQLPRINLSHQQTGQDQPPYTHNSV